MLAFLSKFLHRTFRANEAPLPGPQRRTLSAIAVVALSVPVVLAVSPAAAAPGEDRVGPDASTESALVTTIETTPADFSPTGFVTIAGTRQPGSSVVVSMTATGARVCTSAASENTSWACAVAQLMPNGADIGLTATETPAASAPRPAPGTTTVDVLGPPVMDGTGRYLTTGLVSGRGHPESSIRVSIDGSVDTSCAAVPVSTDGYWSCNVAAGSSTRPYTVRSQQSSEQIGGGRLSGYSNAQQVTIDRDPPESAVITSPLAGARIERQPAVVSGSGESNASVDVYLDNVPVCSTTVRGTAWSCEVSGVRSGPHSLQTVQRDAAGNFAAPSAPVPVEFGPAATPTPSPGTEQPADPGTPAPVPEGDGGTDPGTGAPAPQPAPDAEPQPEAGPQADPPERPDLPDWSVAEPSEALTNWGTPTGFGGSLAAFDDSGARGPWYASPVLGLVFLALIALPLRLLATALRGRVAVPHGRFTGRNRNPRIDSPEDVPRPVNPWVAGAVPVAAAAGLIVLAGGVNGEVRYLRLLIAVGLGLTILNVVGTALLTRWGARRAGTSTRLRFLPLMLLAAALATLVSRFAGLEPPLVVGVLIGVVFAASTPARSRAIVSLVHVGGVLVLGLLAWFLHGLLGPVTGFWGSLASETLATVCLAGLGSALVLALPLATLPGRVILEWSLAVWVGTVLTVASIVAAVVYGNSLTPGNLVPWLVVAGVFSAVSLAMWLFVRFVDPRTAIDEPAAGRSAPPASGDDASPRAVPVPRHPARQRASSDGK